MHACICRGVPSIRSSRNCWCIVSHSSMAIRRRSLRVVGGSYHPKTALVNVSQACLIGFMSWEHAGHSSLAMLLSWRNSLTRCAQWGQKLLSIKTNSSLKFSRYGCTVGQRMSFLYHIAISAPSMTTSGVRRPHIMPPQNIREPLSCYLHQSSTAVVAFGRPERRMSSTVPVSLYLLHVWTTSL